MATLLLSGLLAVFFLVSGTGAVLRARRALASPVHREAIEDGDVRDRAIVQLTLGVVFLLTFCWTLATG